MSQLVKYKVEPVIKELAQLMCLLCTPENKVFFLYQEEITDKKKKKIWLQEIEW